MTKEEIGSIELLEEIDKLQWWIDFGQYQGAKTITIPKIESITAEELVK